MLRLSDDILFYILNILPNREFGRLIRTCQRIANLRHNKFVFSARKCNLYRNYGTMITCTHKKCSEYVIRFTPKISVLSRHLVHIAAKNGDVDILRRLLKKGVQIDTQEIALIGAGQINVLKFLIKKMDLNKDHISYNNYYILLLAKFDDEIFKLLYNLGVSIEHLFGNMRIRVINYLIARKKFTLLMFILQELDKVNLTQEMKNQIKSAQFALQFQDDNQIVMRKLEKLYSS